MINSYHQILAAQQHFNNTVAAFDVGESFDSMPLDAFQESLAGLNQKQQIAVISSSKLSDEQKELLLTELGLTTTTSADTVATEINTGANQKNALSLKQRAAAAWAAIPAVTKLTLAATAVAAVVSIAVQVYDALTKSEEELAEATENLTSKYKELKSEADSHQKTVEDIAERYEELSKGVNTLGENVSLTTDEYKEYQNICNKIADMYPEMVQGYDAQGNAILKLTAKVKGLTEAYQAEQEAAYRTLLYGDYDTEESGQDILDYYQRWYSEGDLGEVFEADWNNQEVVGITISSPEAKKVLAQMTELNADEAHQYINSLYNDNMSAYRYLFQLGYSPEMTESEFAEFKKTLYAQISVIESDLESRLSHVQGLLQASLYLDGNDVLDEDLYSVASAILNNIGTDIADEMDTIVDITVFTNNLIDSLNSADNDIQQALKELFTVDLSQMGAVEAQTFMDGIIAQLEIELADNPFMTGIINAIKESVGYENIKDAASNYNVVTHKFAKDVTGYDPIFNFSPDLTEKYNAVKAQLDEFAEKYSINTQDEIAAFNDALEESNGNIEKAFELYLQKMGNNASTVSLEDWLKSSFSSDNTYKEEIEEWESEIGELQGILDNINSGDTSVTAADILIEFPDMQPYIEQYGDLSSAVEAFVHDSYNELLESFGDTSNVENFSAIIEYLQRVLNKGLGGSNDVKKINSSYEELIGVLDRVRKGDSLTTEEMAALINKYDDLEDAVIVTSGGYSIEEEALIGLINNYISLSNTAISSQISATQTLIENSKIRIRTLIGEQKQLKNIFGDKGLNISPSKANELMDELMEIWETTGSQSEVSQWLIEQFGLENAFPIIEEFAAYVQSQTDLNELLKKLEESYKKQEELANADAMKEKFDWIETFFTRLQTKIERLGTTINAAFKLFTDRKSAINDTIELLEQEKKAQWNAKGQYEAEAKKVADASGIEKNKKSEIINLIKNGTMTNGIKSGYSEEEQEFISEYQEYWDKAIEAETRYYEIESDIIDKYQERFDLISSEYDARLGVIEHKANMINGMIDQTEASGHMVSTQYYEVLKALETQTQADLLAKKGELEAALADAMKSGVTEGSETWYDLTGQILEVDEAIQESTNSVIEFNNQIRELEWTQFDKIQDLISEIHDEKDFFIELMSNEDLFDDNGNWTEYADATAGLHAVGYNTYMAQAEAYAKEIADLDTKFAGDTSNDYYIERRKELLEAQRENILAAEDEKQAMIDLAREGFEAMLEALNELIDKRKEALNAEKDLYDYQKNVADQTKEIASLEKQLAAYSGDNSEETKAKVQQLKVSLDEAKQNLEETEYDRWKQDQEQMLDKLASDTQEWVDQRLENQDELVRDILASVDGDTDSIKNTLNGLADEVGISMSENMTNIFGQNGSVFTTVNTTLTSIERYVAMLVGEADAKAGNNSNNAGGETNTGGGNQPSNSGSNTDGSQDSEDKKWGSWFTKKKYSYSKSQLEKNKDTSVIDRLAWLGYDNSFDARAKYYAAMGGSGTYTGSAKQNKWMITEMKKHKGYASGSRKIKHNELAWTQENGQELIYRSSDGAILTPLGTGDAVFTSEMTQRLWDIAKTPEVFRSLTATTLPKGFVSNGTNNSVQNDVVMNISLPNVVDVDGFVNELKTNKKFEKVVQSLTIGNALGNNSLNKYKY